MDSPLVYDSHLWMVPAVNIIFFQPLAGTEGLKENNNRRHPQGGPLGGTLGRKQKALPTWAHIFSVFILDYFHGLSL